MKIYFAGSIRGGRNDAEMYGKFIEHLKNYGKVLSEHIGLASLDSSGEKLPTQKIFERDVDWVKEADILVAEVSTPSLGVGYEIRLAEELGKKILCLFRENSEKKLSAMIEGNKKMPVKMYTTIEEGFSAIDEFFS